MARTGDEVVITHITRMSGNRICVAGSTPSGEFVRPLAPRAWVESDLADNGGPFRLGAVIRLPRVLTAGGDPPETEDTTIDSDVVSVVDLLGRAELFEFVADLSADSLGDIFGGDLAMPLGAGCALPQGRGEASLGYLAVDGVVDLFVDQWQKVRANVDTRDFGTVRLPVTDVRFARGAFTSRRATSLNAKIARGSCVAAVGLARPFQVPTDDQPRHWLQLNTLYVSPDVDVQRTVLAD